LFSNFVRSCCRAHWLRFVIKTSFKKAALGNFGSFFYFSFYLFHFIK